MLSLGLSALQLLLHCSWQTIKLISSCYFSYLLHMCFLFSLLSLFPFPLLTLPPKMSWFSTAMKPSPFIFLELDLTLLYLLSLMFFLNLLLTLSLLLPLSYDLALSLKFLQSPLFTFTYIPIDFKIVAISEVPVVPIITSTVFI